MNAWLIKRPRGSMAGWDGAAEDRTASGLVMLLTARMEWVVSSAVCGGGGVQGCCGSG